jgi:D-3-phosphoglycerate dehydrogenase / 2-oxoglutarate reductase
MSEVYEVVMKALPKGTDVSRYDPNAPMSAQIGDAEIIIEDGSTSISNDLIEVAKQAKFIQRFGVGMDHMDVGRVLERGILLANTPGFGTNLAEHAILLMLSLAKHTPLWEQSLEERVVSRPEGDELRGKSLGLIGMGASGSELARLAAAFGMTVRGIDIRALGPERIAELKLGFFGSLESLDFVLGESDYVSIHVPLTPRTRGMIGRREIGLMKRTARIINVARGEIVDEEALAEALSSGRIDGAGLDVFSEEPLDTSHPLRRMRNVVISPHNAGTTREERRRRAAIVGENVQRYLSGRPVKHRIVEAP